MVDFELGDLDLPADLLLVASFSAAAAADSGVDFECLMLLNRYAELLGNDVNALAGWSLLCCLRMDGCSPFGNRCGWWDRPIRLLRECLNANDEGENGVRVGDPSRDEMAEEEVVDAVGL